VGNRIESITMQQGETTTHIQSDHFISSMPVTALLNRLEPRPPANILEAANGLKYRDF
jgi:hypothetical protein